MGRNLKKLLSVALSTLMMSASNLTGAIYTDTFSTTVTDKNLDLYFLGASSNEYGCYKFPDNIQTIDSQALMNLNESKANIGFRNNSYNNIEEFLNDNQFVKIVLSDSLSSSILKLLARTRNPINYKGKDYTDAKHLPITLTIHQTNCTISQEIFDLLSFYENATIVFRSNTTRATLEQFKNIPHRVVYNGVCYKNTLCALDDIGERSQFYMDFNYNLTANEIDFLMMNPTTKIICPRGIPLTTLDLIKNIQNPINYEGKDYEHIVDVFDDTDLTFVLPCRLPFLPIFSDTIIMLLYIKKCKVCYNNSVYNNIEDLFMSVPAGSKIINMCITSFATGDSCMLAKYPVMPTIPYPLIPLIDRIPCNFVFDRNMFRSLQELNEYICYRRHTS